MSSASAPPARITALDGLRGLAIGLVLLHHVVQLRLPTTAPWAASLDSVLQLSWSGVDLFFVLSGFLIGGILIDHRKSPRLAPIFYLRRSLRILPLCAVTLLVLFGYLGMGDYSKLPAWVYATFTSNIGMAYLSTWDGPALSVLWSLAVEEQFYLLSPWLILWLRPARLPYALVSMIVLAWVFRLIALSYDPSGFSSHLLMPCRMDAFGLGMLVAWAVRSSAARAWLTRYIPRWWLPLVLLSPALIALSVTHARQGQWALCLYGYTSLGLFYAWSVYVVVAVRPTLLVHVLDWRPLVSLGRLSYFIYLWHVIVLTVLNWRLLHTREQVLLDTPSILVVIVAAVAVTWALAALSWRVFEGPLVRWGQRFAY